MINHYSIQEERILVLEFHKTFVYLFLLMLNRHQNLVVEAIDIGEIPLPRKYALL